LSPIIHRGCLRRRFATEPVRDYPLLNIVDGDEIAGFVESFAGRVRRPEAQRWFRCNVRNHMLAVSGAAKLPHWIQRAARKGLVLHRFEPYEFEVRDDDFGQEMHNVADWLEALPDDDRLWRQLQRMAVPDAVAHARAWHRAFVKRAGEEWPEDWSGLRTVYRFENGAKFVELSSPAALEREGRMMGHCVASYARNVARGISLIYSLRDIHNNPHVTMEVVDNKVRQVQGKANSAVAARWRPNVVTFVREKGWGWSNERLLGGLHVYQGRVYADAGEIIAELARFVDPNQAAFDWTPLFSILSFVQRLQGEGIGLTPDHQRALLAFLQAGANPGYRVVLKTTPALDLPHRPIGEVRIEIAGAAMSLMELGILGEIGGDVAELCRKVGQRVLALIEKSPGTLFRLHIATGGPAAANSVGGYFLVAGLANEFARLRAKTLACKRQRMAEAITRLRHCLVDRRRLHLVSECQRAKAINLIQVQAPRFSEHTLRDTRVA
jgi:hypothetical protein